MEIVLQALGKFEQDFIGVAELGVIAGAGMFIGLAASLTIIPALLADSQAPPRSVDASPPWIKGPRAISSDCCLAPSTAARAICICIVERRRWLASTASFW